MIQFDKQKLQELMMDFYNITHIKICILNENFEEILYFPARYNTFCTLIHSSHEGSKMCDESDMAAFEKCRETKKYRIYTCPMGLTEAIAPIMISNIIVGFIMLGQVRSESFDVGRLLAKTTSLGINPVVLKAACDSLPMENSGLIASASHILDACASYLFLAKQVEIIGDDTATEINDFVDNHLDQDLGVETLCCQFLMTRVQIYDLFHRNFGMTVAEYVRKKRMEKAAELLKESTILVKEVAARINQDYNYFSKEFFKYYDMTPKDYQKKFRLV